MGATGIEQTITIRHRIRFWKNTPPILQLSTLNSQYTWGLRYIDDLICRDDYSSSSSSPTRLFFLQDANWNVTALTNTTGTVVERYRYSAYGQPTFLDSSWGNRTSSSYSNSYLFTGRELDTATGLYFYRARYYHPSLGRFTSRDPIGYDAEDPNLYRYVRNNPLNATDPTGAATLAPNSKRCSQAQIDADNKGFSDAGWAAEDAAKAFKDCNNTAANWANNKISEGKQANSQWNQAHVSEPLQPAMDVWIAYGAGAWSKLVMMEKAIGDTEANAGELAAKLAAMLYYPCAGKNVGDLPRGFFFAGLI